MNTKSYQQHSTVIVPADVLLSSVPVASVGSGTGNPGPFFLTNALEAADKSLLRYDYARWKGNKTYQALTDTFKKQLASNTKVEQPRIDLLAGTTTGVFADFDDLDTIKWLIPIGFSSSWEDVRRWLGCQFSTGCVFPSASGKAKVFFPFTETGLTTQKLRNRLRTLLGEDYYNATDKNGLRYSFINSINYPIIRQWIKSTEYTHSVEQNNKILKTNTDLEKSKDIVLTSKPDYKWVIFSGSLPENMLDDLTSRSKNHNLEGIIRYALGTITCTNTGVALPQELVASVLGVPQQTISRAIRTLINLGVIKKVSMEKAHCKAAKYQFCGFWLPVAINIHKTINRPITGSLKAITESIAPGNWNMPLFLLTNHFKSLDTYLEYVYTIPGFTDKPERLVQAINAWKCHSSIDANKIKGLKYA